MFLFWLVILLLVIVLIAGTIKRLWSEHARAAPRGDRNRALEVLEERYARGEISRGEYRRKRRDLTRPRVPR